MRRVLFAASLASTLVAGWAAQARAGVYGEPQVIPGISAETATPYGYAPGTRFYDPDTGYVGQAAPPPPAAARLARPQPVVRTHNLGGGFLEAVLGNGSDDRAAASRAPAASQAYAVPVGASPAEAQSDPYGNVVYAVRPTRMVDPVFQRQEVAYSGPQSPGTIVVDTTSKFLYLVEDHGRALRYGIGVGKPGFLWAGTKIITRKAEWPDWTPPAEMLKRRPDLPIHMEGGIANPLGARAMYLGSTLYRIHGTNEPETIGTNVSSGCIRLTNDDVSDLYTRVRVGTRVVVM